MQVFFSVFWWIYFFIFYSGYPLLYFLVYLISKRRNMHNGVTEKILSLLPSTYAFVSTLFWILMLWTGKMNFIAEKIASASFASFAIAYSFSALLFWLPYFRKNIYASLLHSLPLFLMPFLNMLYKTYMHKIIPHDYIFNLWRIYAAGFIIYIIALAFLFMIKWLLSKTLLPNHNKA